jgi:hypothetical protein
VWRAERVGRWCSRAAGRSIASATAHFVPDHAFTVDARALLVSFCVLRACVCPVCSWRACVRIGSSFVARTYAQWPIGHVTAAITKPNDEKVTKPTATPELDMLGHLTSFAASLRSFLLGVACIYYLCVYDDARRLQPISHTAHARTPAASAATDVRTFVSFQSLPMLATDSAWAYGEWQ